MSAAVGAPIGSATFGISMATVSGSPNACSPPTDNTLASFPIRAAKPSSPITEATPISSNARMRVPPFAAMRLARSGGVFSAFSLLRLQASTR